MNPELAGQLFQLPRPVGKGKVVNLDTGPAPLLKFP
jgi:hypothetical protein